MGEIEVLAATMFQSDFSLAEKMNIRTSAIFANQCDTNAYSEMETAHGLLKLVSTNLRGVGANRNTALLNATGDICILADDDMVFRDDYVSVAHRCFEDHPEADVIIFNFTKESPGRRVTKKAQRIGYHNYMNYGAARLAFRRKSISYHGIFFNTMFGGGTPHQCGEDTLFLNSCLRAGLRIIAVPEALAELTEERASTWFKGYTDRYFFDKGLFFRLAHPKMGMLLLLLMLLKHREFWVERSFPEVLRQSYAGFHYLDQ